MSPIPSGSKLASLEQVYVADRAAWRQWLEENHAASPGIWLVFDKKSSRPDRLKYVDAVEEALCFGWIDSTVRTLDDARYVQLMAPRKPKSTWAATNKARVERLTAEGLMAEAGLASVERAKANGSWSSLDAVEAFVVPADLTKALRTLPDAAKNFAAIAPSRRKAFLHWISQAVRAETRAHRVAHVVQLAASNQKSRHLLPAAMPGKPGTKAKSKSASAKRAGSAKSVKSKSTKSVQSKSAKSMQSKSEKSVRSKPAKSAKRGSR
jgi:uncharacterized protein YdeI (YjbR/CyaY-like superfamily)